MQTPMHASGVYILFWSLKSGPPLLDVGGSDDQSFKICGYLAAEHTMMVSEYMS